MRTLLATGIAICLLATVAPRGEAAAPARASSRAAVVKWIKSLRLPPAKARELTRAFWIAPDTFTRSLRTPSARSTVVSLMVPGAAEGTSYTVVRTGAAERYKVTIIRKDRQGFKLVDDGRGGQKLATATASTAKQSFRISPGTLKVGEPKTKVRPTLTGRAALQLLFD